MIFLFDPSVQCVHRTSQTCLSCVSDSLRKQRFPNYRNLIPRRSRVPLPCKIFVFWYDLILSSTNMNGYFDSSVFLDTTNRVNHTKLVADLWLWQTACDWLTLILTSGLSRVKSCDVQSKRLSIIFENNATILKQLCSHRTCIFSVTVSVWIFLMSQPTDFLINCMRLGILAWTK